VVTDRPSVAGGPDPAPPPGDPVNAAFLLIGLGRALRDQADAGLRELGLSLRHLSALGHLARQPGLSYSELARRARVTVQSMQATLNQLEDLGTIERRTTPGRGRTAQLHLTEPGRELLARAMDVLRVADRRLAAQLGPDDHRTLSRILLRAFLLAADRPDADG
jgi:DNA-binding MarR family transcriptional regulator